MRPSGYLVEHTLVHKRRSEAHPTGAAACYGAAGMIKFWRDCLVALLFRSTLWTALIVGAVWWSAR